MYRKSQVLHKSPSQNLRKLTKTNHHDDNDKEIKKVKDRQSPLARLLINSPKGNAKMDHGLFSKHSASRNTLGKETKIEKKKSHRPISGLKADHSSTSKQHRPSSTKQAPDRKRTVNQSSSTDQKKKKREHTEQVKTDEEAHEYKRLQEKLNYLQGKIMAIKTNLVKKTQLKKSQTEKIISIIPKDTKKKDTSKKENTDTNALSKFVTQVHTKHSHNVIKRDPYSGSTKGYYVSEIAQCFKQHGLPLAKDHISQCLQTMKFMKEVAKPSAKDIEAKKILLPRKQQHKSIKFLKQDQKTIILDLDETLIHCNESLSAPHDVQLQINFPTGEQIDAGINIRPFAVDLLQALSKKFQVIIFTASHPCYANVVIDHLDPDKSMVSHRLYRDNCWQTEQGVYVKDLRIISNRNLSDMVLVDNAAYSYFFQLDNGIPIIPYYQGTNDFELKHLLEYIERLENVKDVREVNRKHFKLDRYLEFSESREIASQLYGEWIEDKKT